MQSQLRNQSRMASYHPETLALLHALSSFYGGSNYSPTLPLSRRSSQARDGFISPTGSTFSRPPLNAPLGPTRPVVRLPAQARPHDLPPSNSNAAVHATAGPPPGVFFPNASEAYPLSFRPPLRENRDIQIPMHQPRPQKQVSVASIESPHQGTMPAPKQRIRPTPNDQLAVNSLSNTRSQCSTVPAESTTHIFPVLPYAEPSVLPTGAAVAVWY